MLKPPRLHARVKGTWLETPGVAISGFRLWPGYKERLLTLYPLSDSSFKMLAVADPDVELRRGGGGGGGDGFVLLAPPAFLPPLDPSLARSLRSLLKFQVLKARLHRRYLSRQLDATFVALKLHQVSNMFETPAISRRQIAQKIAPGLHLRF